MLLTYVTLSSRWLEAEERRDDLVSVVVDLISREGDLTDRGMDDPRLVDLEVKSYLTSLP